MVRSLFLALSIALLASTANASNATLLTPGVNAGTFAISPNGNRIVFDSYSAPWSSIYSARVDRVGTPTRLSGATDGDAYLFNSQISDDSSTMVYDRNEYPEGIWHVATYSSRLDGSSPPALLNRSKVFDDDSGQYSLAISANGHHAAIRADQGDYDFNLLGRPTDASSPAVMLNAGDLGLFGGNVSTNLKAVGDHVVFHVPRGDETGVYSRVFDGSEPALKLSPDDGIVEWYEFVISSDKTRVVMPLSAGTTRTLYSTSIATAAKTLLFSKDNSDAITFLQLTPDGSRAVFSIGARQYSVPTDGSATAREFGRYPDGFVTGRDVSANGQLLAYLTRPENHQPTELYVAAMDGTGSQKLLVGGLPEGINSIRFSPDNLHVLYLDYEGIAVHLMSVAVDGNSAPVELAEGGNYIFTADGKSVILLQVGGLYSIPVGGGPPVLLSDNPYGAGGLITQFMLTPDGSTLLFAAGGQDQSGVFAVAIPEPAGFVLLMGAAMMLARRRRVNLR